MVIIFYDANKEQVYICTEHDVTKVVSIDDPYLVDYVPNDDILYVANAHFITKSQFADWLEGEFDFSANEDEAEDEANGVSRFTGMLDSDYQPGNSEQIKKIASQTSPPSAGSECYYLHPTSNGTVRIEDIQTSQFPEGVQLNGKWHFVAVDIIGEDILMDSSHFQVLLGKGKVEIVPESYVAANKHKLQKKKSPYQAALDSILVPADVKAEAAASGGWSAKEGDAAIEILIEG